MRITVNAVVIGYLFLGLPLAAEPQQRWKPSPRATSKNEKISPLLEGVVSVIQHRAALQHPSVQLDYRSFSTPWVRVDREGRIQVYIKLEKLERDSLEELTRSGAAVERANHGRNIVQAWAPYRVLGRIALLSNVRRIDPPDYAVPRSRTARQR